MIRIDRARPGPRPRRDARHNLPAQLTSFIGREREIAELERLLSTTRLLTLIGTPGVGKTRLALQLVARARRAYPDGVWLAELAALADPRSALVPSLVAQAVASALGIPEQPGRPLVEALSDRLWRRTLLVLDNCEHLIGACAVLADSLLRNCPKLRVLVTSREPLGITGEVTWWVPSLSLPDQQSLAPTEILAQSEAVRLFVDRARAAVPTFALTDQNAPAVAQICRRLDGIPLAIELASARVRVLSPEQIATRLDDRFRLLTGGSRTALPRQRTLRALVDWSHDLLSEPEQMLLRRLAVFAGGWTLEAAERVASGQWPVVSNRIAADHWPLPTGHSVLDLLSRLVGRSLVLAEERGGETRYRLLETIREYAHERLEASGEAEEIRLRHAEHYLLVAEEAELKLRGAEQVAWLGRLEAEHDNLRAALRWSIERGRADPSAGSGQAPSADAGQALALRLAGALGWFWYLGGYLSEGRNWLEGVLALTGRAACSTERAKALMAAGTLARHPSDFAAARRRLEQSLALWRELGDRRSIAYALTELGHAISSQGEHATGLALQEESAAIFREVGDTWGLGLALNWPARVALERGDHATARSILEELVAAYRALGDRFFLAQWLNDLGDVARCQGDDERAGALYEESLALFRKVNAKIGIAGVLHNLGYVAHHRDDERRAATLFGESLALFREVGDKRGIAECCAGLAGVAASKRQSMRAARLLGAAEALLAAAGTTIWTSNRDDYERDLAAARAQLDEGAFAAAWAEGRAMSLELTVGYALAEPQPAPMFPVPEPPAPTRGAPRPPDARALTRREEEVAALVARGLTNRQIAAELVVGKRTADAHVLSILGKLGFASRAQIAAWVVEQGLLATRPG